MIFALKLTLVPLLLGLATLAQRRWGEAVGGWIAGFPFVAGPILLFVALEQGPLFAARSAEGAVAGTAVLAVFSLAHAWLARRLPWWAALPAGWGLYLALSWPLSRIAIPLWTAAPLAVAALLGSARCLPPSEPEGPASRPALAELPLRMGAAAGMVWAVTALAERLGPAFTGLLTPFPVATSVLVGFAHARQGAGSVARVLRGFLPSLVSLVVFFVLLALMLPRTGRWGFLLAVAAAAAMHAFSHPRGR